MPILLLPYSSVAVDIHYLLMGTIIKRPNEMLETNSTIYAIHRNMSGGYSRDMWDSNKRVWVLKYENVSKDDYDTIYGSYEEALDHTISFEIIESEYLVTRTRVNVDLENREFSIGGDYLSSFDLILEEA